MLESLDLHLLDLVQNAREAGARRIAIRWTCDEASDEVALEVVDDGRGMDADTLAAVERGFYSTKGQRSVGLGIPLLRQTAEHCDGRFSISSRLGEGTTVRASFRRSHIDLPPFGDVAATFLSILVTSEDRWVSILYRCGGEVDLDTAELRETLGGASLQSPGVLRALQEFLVERVGREG
ncbi:MAG: ATP-binding protein [Candidatus Bipolaricaulota bacterium]